MKNKLHFSPEALLDLDDIWEGIATELQDAALAQRAVQKILATTERLEDFALMGAPLSSIANVNSDYRFLVSGNYLIFYRTCKTEVYIDRILYGRRDYLRILFKSGDTNQN